jgi:hypothetical protein
MKLVRTLSMIIALAGASTVYADTPPKAAPAEKKAPDKAADKPAEKKPELSPADVKKAEAFFDEFYNAVMKNTEACPKMAVAINGVIDKHEKWLKETMASGKDMPQASKDKLQKRQQEMMNGVMKCKDDKDVQAAFQRFASIMMAKKTETSGPAPSTPPATKK